MNCETRLAFAAFDYGRGTKSGQLLEAGKAKKADSPLQPSKETQASLPRDFWPSETQF